MKGLKMTAKRIFTGVLTAAMVVTSVNLPGMATSVQAATVYNDTTTALSELAGSTGLKIYRLTSDDAGKELTSGIYYVDEDLTFTGADSTSSSQAGGNGLKIADGATVYIYIADGKTLTATGGNGYAATNGANGTDGDITTSGSSSVSGLKFTFPGKAQQAAGGTGGTGATGGGAGIFVPASSKLVCIGQGNITATGGNGGNAGNGGEGGKTHVRYQSSYNAYNSSNALYTDYNTYAGNIRKISVSGTATESYAAKMSREAPGAGGGAGGGAAGGGAGIGSNGASGNTGVAGANSSATGSKNYDFTKNSASDSNKYSTQNKVAGSAGSIYINCNYNAIGGNGGTAGSQGTASGLVSDTYKTYYGSAKNGTLYTHTFYFMNGQSGGGGAAGGNGAKIGTGGAGGVSGMGGDSGSSTSSESGNSASYCTSQIGANGSKAGADGTGSSATLSDTQYPYNTITFTGAKSSEQTVNYYLTQTDSITAPAYDESKLVANQIFTGWKVTTTATKLPDAFGESSSASTLIGTTKDYQAGDTISTKGIYGNVILTAQIVEHNHSWTYKTDSSKVYAWCVGEENADACPYHGEEKKLTLSLDAEGKTYDGNAYNGATVEDKITSVTKANAGSVTYYKADSDGNKTGSAISAPVNAGKYVAEVTVSDGSKSASATKAFEIKRADQTATVSMSGYEYGKTVSTPDVSGAKENPDVTYYYSTKNENKDGTEWKNIENDTLEPGTYYMYAVLAQTDNYNTYTTAPVSFTVQGSDMSGVTAADVTKTYDGSSYGITVNTGSIPKATVTYGTEAGTYDLSESPAYKNVGTYTIYYKVEARGYNSFTGSATVTITKKAVTATVTAKNKTYDGTTDATVSAEVDSKDLVSGDSITINGITGTFADKNAGTDKKVTVDSSKAEFTGIGVDNYAITIGTEATASIDKLTAEFNWSNIDLTYTGNEQSVTAEVKNAISGDKFTLTYDGNKQTAVGDYTAKVTALGNDNYKLPEADKAQKAWKISYLAKGTAEVSGTKGDNDWYVTKVTITPEAGYEISANGTDWAASLEYNAQGSQTATYYLKETATGFVSDKKTAEFKIDTGLPTGEIKIKDNGFTGFLNTITFKHFFKKTVDVTITGADVTSGVAKIEYQKVAKGASFDKDGTWTEGKSFSMTANDKSAIYARITDNAGHCVIINSDGIVVYTDATATAEETFTRTSTEDVTTGITVNGNTIASVKNGSDTVAESAYEIKEDKLVLKASYLQTLAAGTYTLTVSYNPYGEAYTADSKGDAPDTSVITLTVKKATGSITDISDISKVYDGTAVNTPTFATTNDRGTDDANVTIEYKKQGAEDSTYTSEAPQDYGKYVVRITVKSDDDYETVVTTKEFSIHKKEMKVSADGYTGTYDGQAYGITVNVTEPADSAASNVKVVYGTKDTDGKITYSENPVTYKDAGEYTVYYKVTADNYEDAEGSAVVKIAPKTVSLVWSDTEFTYDGKAHKPTAKVNEKDIISPDSVEVTVSGEQTKAGSYTAQAVALSNGNYTLGADVSTAYVIKKAAATVTVDNAIKHIGKNDPKFTYKVTGLVEGESLTDISLARTEGETAGDYDITATAKDGSNANYDVTFVAGKLTIEDHIKAETPVIENRVEATCTKDGSYDEVYYCTVKDCKAELERVHKTIQATGHKYGEPVFTWSKDYSTVTLTFTCANDKSHIETVEATVTSETVAATCETAGKTIYTATAEFEGKIYTDSKEVEIKAIGHDYANPVFVWSEDYSTAKATFTCTHDAAHISEKDCEVTAKTVNATCTTEGTVTYTASVTLAGKTYTDTKVVNNKALGHKYGEAEFSWSEDYSTAKAVFTCENDKSHIETVEATVTSETVAATCETAGKTVYTATAEFEGKTYTDSKEVEIKAIGHKYGEPVFTWNDDYSKVTATFTCANDKSHIENKEAEVTSATVAATCIEAGKVTYTAEVTFEGKTYSDVKEAVIPATGHDWSEWVKVGTREKSTCSRCGQVRYRNIDTGDTGSLEKDAEVAPGSPITEATLDNDESELIAASGIFTAEEKTDIESGAAARVWIEISATTNIADTDKQNVEAEAKKIMGSDISKVVYFDADLFKSVTKEGTTTKSQITEPGTEIEVSVSLPESLVQTDSTISRAYKIIRLHNGEVDSFDAAFDKETGTLTFKTDRFSTYAIAFTDTQLATGVTLTPDSKTLTKKGETVQLTATVTPDNAANKKVTWTSSDSKVATVDENGLVTAVANGTAIITVTTEDGGKTATAKITVNISSDDDNNGDNCNNNNNNKDNGGSNNNPATTPDNKNNGADTKKDNQSVTSPQTGDTSNLALWTTLFMASLAGLVSLLVKRRKENCK